ncbi:MAG: hydrogenase maturation protease [Cyclobacteriaceae bacterium]|nr:hydrogenase maturation protease [Cyclobacteriaceae bacterium]MCK5467767.1 hydrogenase maturation protease [Cyclobacteriaceae bacterium]
MEDKKHSKLILGIGNDILTDDGIGPKLVQELQKAMDHTKVTFHTAAIGGLEIIEMIRGYERAIIIDGIKTKDGVPGTIYKLTPANFKETLHLSSFHDVSFLTALDLAEKMEIPIPYQIDIIAIEIVEDLTFSNEFSPSIAGNYKQIFEDVLEIVQKLIQ